MSRLFGRSARGEAQAADLRSRYLELLTTGLLDEQYLENEVRIEHLLRIAGAASPDLAALRDPVRTSSLRYASLLAARRSGEEARLDPMLLPYAAEGRPVMDHVVEAVAQFEPRSVAGDVVDCGGGRGGVAVLTRAAMDVHGLADRRLWVVGPFPALEDPGDADAPVAYGADLNQVRDAFDRFGVDLTGVRFLVGETEEVLADAPVTEVALLRIGTVPLDELQAILDRLVPLLTEGSSVVMATRSMDGRHEQVSAALAAAGLEAVSDRVGGGHRRWGPIRRVRADQPSTPSASAPPRRRVAVPAPRSAAARSEARVDLSVVVVFFNMRREAERTLHSLARRYQRGIDDLTYEVIAIDNGSAPEHRLRRPEVERFGPEFRLLDLRDAATPSPTTALNRGVRESRGDAVALMIDGAHVLTPGVLRYAMTGLASYRPAVVGLQQWYVGPGQQGDAQRRGYDQEAEDRLFRSINWPADGYRLFNIGHFIGDRDWLDGMTESGCLFVPREVLEQVGAYDDSFDMAGGGFANLELFERLANHPGLTLTTVLGEGSFHQVHGGTTTNISADAERRETTAGYAAHFEGLRGRKLLGADKDMHYVGALATGAARRTRPRFALFLANDPERDTVATTNSDVAIVADDVRSAATHAAWYSQAWRESTWMGHRLNRYPVDLHLYQELVAASDAPDVVLVADDDGLVGRARYFASLFDQLGRGRVVVLGGDDAVGVGDGHPRIVRTERVERVEDEVGEGQATLFVGLGAAATVVDAFEALRWVVPVGGLAVVEGTVVNGWPVEPEFGPGPHEAVVQILQDHHDWAADVSIERYPITFNPGGYLRRLA